CSYGVRVLTGYHNNITNNTINLTGEGILLEVNSRFNTIQDNKIFNLSLFGSNRGIHVKRSHNTTVTNNFIQGEKPGFAFAIYVDRENVLTAANNTVRNNTVVNAGPILMSGTRYNLVEFNNVTQSSGMGIWVDQRYHEVKNNTIYNCSTDGIDLGSGYNNVSGNIIWGNGDDGIDINFDVNNSVFKNTIYNNSGNGVLIDNGWDDHDIINNTIYGNKRNGVLVQAAGGPGTDNRIIGNDIYNNTISGVHFWQEGFNFIINNNITNNGPAGIIIEAGSNGNNVTGNTVRNHTWSINLTNSDNNFIYNNYFDDPPYADAASTGNSWNITKTLGTNIINGPFLGGNFWGNYNGIDLDGDGLGDTLLPWTGISNGIVNGGDSHPLVTPASVVVRQAILNSTFGNNFTNENLTCYANATQNSSLNITYHGYFFKDNIPQFDILNRSFYNGSNTSNDEANDVVIDSKGNMIITGFLEGHWETVKYSKNGTFLWNISEPPSLFTTVASAVTVDSNDNIIVTGSDFRNIPAFGTIQQVLIIKYDENGTKLWSQNLSYITAFASTSKIYSSDIEVDSNDDIFVTGARNDPGIVNGLDFYFAKFNSAGVYQWIRVLDSGATTDGGQSIVLDSADNVTLGARFNNKGAIFKYTNAGNQIWNVTNVWSTSSAFSFSGIDLDSQGNVIAGGTVWFGGSRNVSVFKYNSTGGPLWNSSTGGSSSSLGDLVVDYEDNIITTGITQAFGVNGSNIYTVKFYSNGTFAWHHFGDFGVNEVGQGIETNMWGEPVIGGRQSPDSGGRRMLLAVYKGFYDYNQTSGILKNVSRVNYTLTSVGDTWRCDVNAYDGTLLSRTVKSNDVVIDSPRPASIQCSKNLPNNFTNCSNLQFFDNITMVRANCTGALSANFILTNVYDGTVFFTNSTTTSVGDWMILNNSDVQILDSGQWSLFASCNFGTLSGNATENFTIPFGNWTNPQILTASQNVTNGNPFIVTTSIGCIGGECVNNTAALDPLRPLLNLTDPTNAVHSVYADSDFIYAASGDNSLYVWNKTGLNLYTTLNDTSSLLSMHADNDYIYAGGSNGNILIWNRTDLVTPFASVYNITGLFFDILALDSDSNYLYAGVKWTNQVFVFDKTNPSFPGVTNLTDPGNFVRALAVDNESLYAGSHNGNVYVYNTSDFTIPPVVLGTCPFSNIKSVSQDSNYIYAVSHDFANTCYLVWHKSNYSVYINRTFSNAVLLSSSEGGPNFAYAGGLDSAWTNGTLIQINKTNFTVADRTNKSTWFYKSLYCDESYLYAGLMNNTYTEGMVRLFNNSCGGAPPAPGININSISITPSSYPITTNTVQCVANVTTAGTVANVTFNITFPNGSSILLGSTAAGDIYTSSNFTVSSTSDHNCTVNANNTNGSSTSRTKSFFGGHKGIIPMGAGSPFYTTGQNPRNGSHQACLGSLIPGQTCNSTWSVVPNGNVGDTWAFFTIYESGAINTSRINITLLGGPGPTPTPSGGGGGAATRQYPPRECIESWSCGNWGACIAGIKRRICTDANSCGTTENKPAESASCVVPFADMLEKELKEELPSFEEIEKEEHIVEGSAVVVEEPSANPWKELINSRNFVRAALLALIVSVLVYLFFLSRHLKTSAKPGKKSERLTDESFAAKVAVKKASKPKPKPVIQPKPRPRSKPISKESTEELLNELNKL
ncbi:right-handed parallel beta-helix repeat-containing protein, partial [Candidatus Woesearchaeota archaeon]|nr:right-handed parallel beta-helix repeat-containing protein [Candidatus Woesearchaeota archaeon]